MKPTLVIDIDGVIATGTKESVYSQEAGWAYENCVPVEGALEALKTLHEKYRIVLHTARWQSDLGKTSKWLKENGFSPYYDQLKMAKPSAVAYIDDKGFRFRNWEETLKEFEVPDKFDLMPKGSKVTKLMIVAHPDDEVLFSGGELDETWRVVCLTNMDDLDRLAEFFCVARCLGFEASIRGNRDCWDGWTPEEMIKVEEEVRQELMSKDWEAVATHNAQGEYGHKQHIQVHDLVKGLAKTPVKVFSFHDKPKTLPNMIKTFEALSLYKTRLVGFDEDKLTDLCLRSYIGDEYERK